MNTFFRVTICPVSGCIGRIEEEFMSRAVLVYKTTALSTPATVEPVYNGPVYSGHPVDNGP